MTVRKGGGQAAQTPQGYVPEIASVVPAIKPALSDRLALCLRPAKTPQAHNLLSGVVYVVDSVGKGFSYVHFDERLVTEVGRALPMGISPDRPAFLKVMYLQGSKVWRVFAGYVNEHRFTLLWESKHQPVWLARIHRSVRRDSQGGEVNANTIIVACS